MKHKTIFSRIGELAEKNRTLVLILILATNAFAFLIAYNNYIKIAIELGQSQALIFPYCATASLIASLGICFYLLDKHDIGEFIELISVSWLMFFGFVAIAFQFVYFDGIFDFNDFGWFSVHAFMFFEGIYFIKKSEIKEIVFPISLGAALLVLVMLASKDFMNLIIFWFFQAAQSAGLNF